jgi:hypothetical protein
MAKSKIIKQIVYPEARTLGGAIEQTRAMQQSQLRDEIRRESALLEADGTAPVTNPEAQAGRVLSRQEVVRRLRRLNPALSYETSVRYPEQGGIYITENRMDPVTGKSPWKRFVCGLPSGTVREFALRLTVPKVIPDPTIALHWRQIQAVDQQVPGWRSVLLKLIMEDLITPSGAEKEFQITRGRSSRNWQAAMT